MLKKILILFFIAILVGGCRQKDEVEEISFSTWGSVTEIKILKKIINDFEKENPNIKVNLIHIPQNYFQKIHLLFASNNAPDVIFINNQYLPLYSSQLLDLSEYNEKEEFYPQTIEGLSYDNKLLAIPRDISSLVLYVNKDLVDIPQNLSLENLPKICEKIDENRFCISFEEDIYFAQPYLAYFGENFEDIVKTNNSKGLNYYKDLRDKYGFAPKNSQIGSSTLAQMFLDKKIGIYLSGRWMYPKISEKAHFNWEIVPFPKGVSPLPCDSSGWAISKSSKKKDNAIKFIQYLSSKKSSKKFSQTGLIIPARIKTAEGIKNIGHKENVFIKIIKDSQITKYTKNYKKIADKFNKENF